MQYVHDGPFRSLLDGLAAELSGVPELAQLALGVTLVPSLEEGLIAAVASPPLRIELDASRFEHAFDWERRAVIVHETAHAWRHSRGAALAGERECYEADLLVVEWHVGDWFLDARSAMVDTAYRDVLAAAATEGREKAEPLYEAWARRRDALGEMLGHFRT